MAEHGKAPNKCSVCGSKDLDCGAPRFCDCGECDDIVVPVTCDTCQAMWLERYHFYVVEVAPDEPDQHPDTCRQCETPLAEEHRHCFVCGACLCDLCGKQDLCTGCKEEIAAELPEAVQ